MTQFACFRKDVSRMVGKKKSRLLYVWVARSFWGLLLYRSERSMFLLMGRAWGGLRIPLLPLLNAIQAYSNIDIHYRADIKGGIQILHGSVGIVISAEAVIGENLMLTGGNVIGRRGHCPPKGIKLGKNISLGANAVVLGPVELADNISIGALACVTRNCLSPGAILTGVPAREMATSA